MTGRLVAGGIALGLVALAAVVLARREAPGPPSASVSVAEVLAGDAAGFARATAPRPLVFPDDHGPHPEYRTEWWYYTGNLTAADGRHVGFQLTFFRTALAPAAPPRASAWATAQVYMAHFAVTDTSGRRFHARQRLARGAVGLAGAQGSPFRVWTDDWSAEATGEAAFPVRLRAADGGVAIDLTLARGKPVVLQGDRGLSRKGPGRGDASYYYSLTRMPARGRVTLDGRGVEVSGLAWMDREWSTSALGGDQVGWDWFALQLDDGRDVMFYQLRRRDGSADPFSAGTLVAADGTSRALGAADVRVEVLEWWASPRDGIRYPARWRLAVPSAGLDLGVVPRLADQELLEPVRYWEGAVRVEGRGVGGHGYVELVGYAGRAADERAARRGR
jgi:predicted secreted hydrolase